jgi:RhtB (resistance to homoserine/threonine) family protein
MVNSQVLAFTAIAALLTITPGADTMLVMRSVLARGQRAGIFTALGICSGLFIHATVSALGLSLILVRSAAAFEIVKLAGAGYLLWIGAQSIWRVLRARDEAAAGADRRPVPSTRSAARSFLEGLLTNLLNPKVAIFYLAFLPQFIRPGAATLSASMLLATIHCALGLLWLSLLTVFLNRLRALLTRAQIQRRLEALTGLILIGFGLRLALERR